MRSVSFVSRAFALAMEMAKKTEIEICRSSIFEFISANPPVVETRPATSVRSSQASDPKLARSEARPTIEAEQSYLCQNSPATIPSLRQLFMASPLLIP
jgi:hypothetical protein